MLSELATLVNKQNGLSFHTINSDISIETDVKISLY